MKSLRPKSKWTFIHPPRLLSVSSIFAFAISTMILFALLWNLSTLTISTPLLSTTTTTTTRKPPIRLTSTNTINLTIFSDLHYGENEDSFGILQDIESSAVIRSILSHNDTTFAILNGDLITGENTFLQNSSDYIDTIAKNFVDNGMRWASTYGNHDSKFNLSRERSFEKEREYELSYTKHGPLDLMGVTNYYLPIYPYVSDDNMNALDEVSESEIPIAILWFFDSLGGSPYQTEPANVDSGPNWVPPSTVSWFRSENALLQRQWGVLPSIAFVHIPPQVFLDFQNAGFTSENYPGLNADVPLAYEGDDGQDVEFMQALVDTEGLHSVYSGHDHGDSWCGTWMTPTSIIPSVSTPFICFCKHSGYGGYGTWNRGARVVQLSFSSNNTSSDNAATKMAVESWVRMENGSIITNVFLNETYVEDVYPTADGE